MLKAEQDPVYRRKSELVVEVSKKKGVEVDRLQKPRRATAVCSFHMHVYKYWSSLVEVDYEGAAAPWQTLLVSTSGATNKHTNRNDSPSSR